MNFFKKSWTVLGLGLFTFVLAGCGSVANNNPENVALAQCLTDQGVVFYGAYWCPHCANQKAAFGANAQEFLPYVECADEVNDPQGAQACTLAGVKSFPTWKFPDGTTLLGEQQLSTLATQASCTADVLARYMNDGMETLSGDDSRIDEADEESDMLTGDDHLVITGVADPSYNDTGDNDLSAIVISEEE